MGYARTGAIRNKSKMIRRWSIGFFASVSVLSAAQAQDSDSVIVQIPTATAPGLPGRQLSPSRVDGGAAAQGVGQLSPARGAVGTSSGTAQPQLTREGRNVRADGQLYRGGRTAQGAEPLSRPADGRTGAIARVGGSDRCDRAQTDAAVIRACARAIETRSGEFAKPQAVALSPEQRLLVDQPLREGQDTTRSASRRLAGEGQAETLEEQSVASVALRQGDVRARPVAPDAGLPALSPEAQAFINALVGAVPISPPRP